MVKYKRESDMHVYNVLVTALVVGVLSSTASSHHQILQPKHIKKTQFYRFGSCISYKHQTVGCVASSKTI